MNEPHVHGELDALLDGALEALRREAVEAHVSSCAECAAALERARRVAHAVAGVPVPDPGEAYWARFADRVDLRATPRPTPRAETAPIYERLLQWLVPAGRWGWVGTASVLATATLVVYVGMRGYKPQPVSMPNRMEGVQRDLEAAPPSPPSSSTVTPLAPAPSPPTPSPAAPETERTKTAPGHRAVAAKPAAKARPSPPPAALRPMAKAATDAAAPVEAAQEQVQGRTAPAGESPLRDTQDPVLQFARDALRGSADAKQAQYAGLAKDDFAAIPAPDAALLRGWRAPGTSDARLDRAPAPPAAAKTKENDLAPQKQAAGGTGTLQAFEPSPTRSQLQILDALIWPRRDDPAGRDTVAELTQAWQRHAATDPQARARVRELAAWLADTSPASDERARWEAVRNGAADR